MGFFFAQSAADARASKRGAPKVVPIHLMQQQGCLACPLDERDKNRKSPKMKPAGSTRPEVYILDGSPSEKEDAEDQPLLGWTGDLVYSCIPRDMREHVRVGYAVRCRSMSGNVGVREVTCCSQYSEGDIEATRPRVVVGLGEVPLRWALGDGAPDSVYRGRFWPIRVGHHVCWYYQMQSPTFVQRMQEKRKYDTEYTKAFRFDLRRLFEELLPDLADKEPPYVEVRDRERGIEIITGHGEMDIEHLAQRLDDACREPLNGVDIETTALRPYNDGAEIVTCSVATPSLSIAFPVEHPKGWHPSLRREVRGMLVDYLERSNRKVCHNLSFEQEWFGHKYGKHILRRTEWEDSMAAAHTLDERRGALNLGAVTNLRFGFNVKKLSVIDVKNILASPLETVLKYNALDSLWSLRAFISMEPELRRDEKLEWEYLRKVRLSPTLVWSQLRGVPVDLDYARRIEHGLTDEIETATRLLSKAKEVRAFEDKLGRPFRPGNDDDVVVLLRDIMKREEGAKEGGGYSGDDATLASIPPSAGIAPQQVQAYRAANKLLGTYITPLLNRDTGKGTVQLHDDDLLHTNYNSMVAVTGRLSSDDPNLQNYPKRKRKEVRGVIVCPDGFGMDAFDYGQLEARIIAMASEDRALVDSMWTAYDIHAFWAERFVHHYPSIKDWIVSEFEVDWAEKGLKTLRQEAKNKWVFPMFFGSSHRSCAKSLHVPEDIAEAVADEFWDTFSGVKRWQKRLVEKYERNLYVETLTGRRRRGPMSLNEIINTPIQGTGADLVTDAQNRLSEYADANDLPQLSPPINVHDDLTFFLPLETRDRDASFIAHEMCNAKFDFINVPVVVEHSRSPRHWHELKEVAVYRSDEFGYHMR